jgi:hypothetical protein
MSGVEENSSLPTEYINEDEVTISENIIFISDLSAVSLFRL